MQININKGNGIIITDRKIFLIEPNLNKELVYDIVMNLENPYMENDEYRYFFSKQMNITEIKIKNEDHKNKLIRKYINEKQQFNLFGGEDYRKFIKNQDCCSWIINILSGHNEVDRVIFENKYGKLLLSPKESHKNTENWLFFFYQGDKIWSIGDLNSDNLDMLKNVKLDCLSYFKNNKIFLFFHFLPQFPWLHLHITLDNNRINDKRCYLLDEVINNLEVNPNFYINHKLGCIT